MGQNSKIEWTHHTFNPWWGCAKVSPGCQHCYAERDSTRWGFDIWGPKAQRRFFGDTHWREPLKWNRDAEKAGERHRVFCASMADVAENRRDLDPQRERLWSLIEQTPWLDWLLLTKRPENLHEILPSRWTPHKFGRPPRNVWFGTSAEDQEWFDRRWPVLKHFGQLFHAAKLFISAEPLLGPINLEIALKEERHDKDDHLIWIRAVDWVIVGGESGPHARPMYLDWARSIRDQCVEAEIPFLFKQWGEWGEILTRVGKHATGRLLDGRTWDEFPAP